MKKLFLVIFSLFLISGIYSQVKPAPDPPPVPDCKDICKRASHLASEIISEANYIRFPFLKNPAIQKHASKAIAYSDDCDISHALNSVDALIIIVSQKKYNTYRKDMLQRLSENLKREIIRCYNCRCREIKP